jgi:hypothetical protein
MGKGVAYRAMEVLAWFFGFISVAYFYAINNGEKMDPFLKISVGASIVRLKLVMASKGGGGGVRGAITKFSRQSRKRMIDTLHEYVFEEGVLVTMTYPGSYPTSAGVYKRHLQSFRKWLDVETVHAVAFWRLEFQDRGAAHFHVFVTGVRYVDARAASKKWDEIIGAEKKEGGSNGVDVKPVRSGEGVRNVGAYVSKYISKDVSSDEGEKLNYPGRYWGVWNGAKKKNKVFAVSADSIERMLEAVGTIQAKFGRKWDYNKGVSRTVYLGTCGSSEGGKEMLEFLEKKGVETAGLFLSARRVERELEGERKKRGCNLSYCQACAGLENGVQCCVPF